MIMKTSRRFIASALVVSLTSATRLFAHEGHPHAPGSEGQTSVTGIVEITAEAKRNLGVTVAEAEMRNLEKVLTAFGHIEPIPQMTAAITSRIAGRVINFAVVEGQDVKKGQPLVEIESLQVGNPPPRVTVASPLDGIVLARHVVLGSSVEQAGRVLDVADLSVVHAEAFLFEGQIGAVKPAQKVRVQVESYPGETFEGVIDRVAGSLDAETRRLQAHVEVKNPDNRLRPNMRATIHIVTGEADSVIAVPHSAVLGELGQPFVFVQTDEEGLKYERRTVITGTRDDKFIEITEGVLPGDKVVTSGNYQLQYVTATPAGGEKKEAPAADAHTARAETGRSVGAPFRPTTWLLIIGLGISVLLNVVLLARRTA